MLDKEIRSETHGIIEPPDVGECCLAAFSRASIRRPVMYTFAPFAANVWAALFDYQYVVKYRFSRYGERRAGKYINPIPVPPPVMTQTSFFIEKRFSARSSFVPTIFSC